jgi:hypothetical protein
MVAAKSAQKESHAVRHGHSNGNGKTIAHDLERHLRSRQVKQGPLPETVGHVKIASTEPKTNQIPAGGHAARSRGRPNFQLLGVVSREYAPSIFFNQVIEHIEDGKLAYEVGQKMYPQLVIAVFKTLDHMSFSLVPQQMYQARKHVFELINENHDAIYANLWLPVAPKIETVTEAIQKKRRILRLFKNEIELELLEDKLTATTKAPGWLAIETAEPVLKRANGHGGLTLDRVLTLEIELVNRKERESLTLFSYLQRTSLSFFEQKKRALESETYLRMPMSTERIAGRIRTAQQMYSLPRFAIENHYKVLGNSVAFEDSMGKTIHRSRIALFVPALEVIELQDGNVTALVGSSLIGLSREEMDYLRPKYQAAMMTIAEHDKTDWVEDKRQQEARKRLTQLREWQEAGGDATSGRVEIRV